MVDAQATTRRAVNGGQDMIGGRIAPEPEAVMERWRWTCDCGVSDYAHRADDCAADLLDHLAGSHYFVGVGA